MYVLGINDSHVATACLMADGEIIACASEERFTRIKNVAGFPIQACRYVMDTAGIEPGDIDLLALSFTNPRSYGFDLASKDHRVGEAPMDFDRRLGRSIETLYEMWGVLESRLPFLEKPFLLARAVAYEGMLARRWKVKQTESITRQLDITPERVVRADHHHCHALAAYHCMEGIGRADTLVMTLDGAGDGLCGSVRIMSPSGSRLIATIPHFHSPATLYGAITQLLGMKLAEHEYKVMGLAPYADPKGVERTYAILRELIWLDEGLQFRTKMSDKQFYPYLQRKLQRHRFDWIAGAAQKLVEELLVAWVRRAIQITGIRRVAVGGGIFMNVKANMLIKDLPEVDELFICPSAGDESTAIGAAIYAHNEVCRSKGSSVPIAPLTNLYLGPEFNEAAILHAMEQHKVEERFKVSWVDDIETQIAHLLAQGKVVARLSGRMEWGARALGNRSIMANPSDPDVVPIINDQIKMRDFWMPFAPTILEERQHDYIINTKNVAAPYMVLAFETTALARRELKAALHPSDKTCRPQVLRKQDNEAYYRIIKHFEELTGIGGVLNTSFNLHGDPIVCGPQDALYTFENSGLTHLALGNYLISKGLDSGEK